MEAQLGRRCGSVPPGAALGVGRDHRTTEQLIIHTFFDERIAQPLGLSLIKIGEPADRQDDINTLYGIRPPTSRLEKATRHQGARPRTRRRRVTQEPCSVSTADRAEQARRAGDLGGRRHRSTTRTAAQPRRTVGRRRPGRWHRERAYDLRIDPWQSRPPVSGSRSPATHLMRSCAAAARPVTPHLRPRRRRRPDRMGRPRHRRVVLLPHERPRRRHHPRGPSQDRVVDPSQRHRAGADR